MEANTCPLPPRMTGWRDHSGRGLLNVRYLVVPLRTLDAGHSAAPVPTVEWAAEPTAEPAPGDALAQWVAAARTSLDACLVVDAGGTVAGLSSAAALLLGAAPHSLIGRSLDEALALVDFTDVAHEAQGAARRIPPLIAVRDNSLSRGMMRVRLPDGERLMLDAVAAPIHDSERRPIGAVSFLASV